MGYLDELSSLSSNCQEPPHPRKSPGVCALKLTCVRGRARARHQPNPLHPLRTFRIFPDCFDGRTRMGPRGAGLEDSIVYPRQASRIPEAFQPDAACGMVQVRTTCGVIAIG